jgi:hypothetical protein
MKICRNCEHFNESHSETGPIWYLQLCEAPAVRKPEGICPQTGEKFWWAVNSLGNRYPSSSPFPFAKDINPTGECPHFTSFVRLRPVGGGKSQ